MLVIPAIDLRGGRCVRFRDGAYEKERVFFEDPVRMAKLWRVMNAKILHLAATDPDEQAATLAMAAEITSALDIPVQLGGGLLTVEDAQRALTAGVYRVVLGSPFAEDPDAAKEALDVLGGSRVQVALDVSEKEGATELAASGVRRFLATGARTDSGPDVAGLRAFTEAAGRARVTVADAVNDYRDLLALQSLEGSGLDSVIVGAALYENRFPCQRFWCWHRKDELDLDRFSTARLALRDR